MKLSIRRVGLVLFFGLALRPAGPVLGQVRVLEYQGAKVEIYRDFYGVPHIRSSSEAGVAFGNGFAIAQDRLGQLERFRRSARGEMAELVGRQALNHDIEVRKNSYTEEERWEIFNALKPQFKQMLQAYADGVNAYAQEARRMDKIPQELKASGLDFRPWSVTDSIAIAQMMARRFGSGGGGELRNLALYFYLKRRFRRSPSGQNLALKVLGDILWLNDPQAPTTLPHSQRPPNYRPRYGLKNLQSLEKLLDLESVLPYLSSTGKEAEIAFAEKYHLPTKFGSYAIVIGKKRSAGGYPILIGGPQMGFSTPQIAHEVHLVGPGLDVAGMGFAGIPGVLIGFNPYLAWTTTSGIGDLEDIFVEKLDPQNPSRYWYKGSYRPMERRVEVIKVKGENPVTLEVFRTIHGPVIGFDYRRKVAFSRSAFYWKREMQAIEAFYRFNRARNLQDFAAACALIATSHNFFCATRGGDIGYWYCGYYPIRPPGTDPRFPLLGTGEQEWLGRLPFSAHPQAMNPPQGYLVNWNNKPAPWWDNGDTPVWGTLFRVRRIQELVTRRSTLTPEQVRNILPDIGKRDFDAPYFVPPLVKALLRSPKLTPLEKNALNYLRYWDYYHDHYSVAKVLFDRFFNHLRELLFLDDLGNLGNPSLFALAVQPSLMYRALNPKHVRLPPSRDYLNGQSPESLMINAFKKAVEELAQKKGKQVSLWGEPRGWIHLDPLPPIPDDNRGTYILCVELDRPEVHALSVLCPGQNEDPSTLHYSDQRELAGYWLYKPLRLKLPEEPSQGKGGQQ